MIPTCVLKEKGKVNQPDGENSKNKTKQNKTKQKQGRSALQVIEIIVHEGQVEIAKTKSNDNM